MEFISNDTLLADDTNAKSHVDGYNNFRATVHYVIIPIICGLGILGNLLNLCVFSRRRRKTDVSELEQASLIALTFLTLADLLFCLTGLCVGIVEGYLSGTRALAMYATAYKTALLNTFLFWSTWIVTAMALQRYVIIRHPLTARSKTTPKQVMLVNVVVCGASIAFNVPLYFQYSVYTSRCGASCMQYYVYIGQLFQSSRFASTYHILWATFGAVIPALLLTCCNISFITEIFRQKKKFQDRKTTTRLLSTSKHAQNQVTLLRTAVVLVAIIAMFDVLVLPSMVLDIFLPKVATLSESRYRAYMYAVTTANLAQAVNFSANFVLYSATSRNFRHAASAQLNNLRKCAKYVKQGSSGPLRFSSRHQRTASTKDAVTS